MDLRQPVLAQLDERLPKNEFVRIENGELVLTPLDEEETDLIAERLMEICSRRPV